MGDLRMLAMNQGNMTTEPYQLPGNAVTRVGLLRHGQCEMRSRSAVASFRLNCLFASQ